MDHKLRQYRPWLLSSSANGRTMINIFSFILTQVVHFIHVRSHLSTLDRRENAVNVRLLWITAALHLLTDSCIWSLWLYNMLIDFIRKEMVFEVILLRGFYFSIRHWVLYILDIWRPKDKLISLSFRHPYDFTYMAPKESAPLSIINKNACLGSEYIQENWFVVKRSDLRTGSDPQRAVTPSVVISYRLMWW